jgi:hypothetical protein
VLDDKKGRKVLSFFEYWAPMDVGLVLWGRALDPGGMLGLWRSGSGQLALDPHGARGQLLTYSVGVLVQTDIDHRYCGRPSARDVDWCGD